MGLVSFGTESSARRKRVKYVNASGGTLTVYQGEPMCYNWDATTNILGYSDSEGGGVDCQTTPTTTAEGYQNEAKFLQVENVASANLQWFAGVVAPGSWCGTSVANGGVLWLEIYVANGAIVPVRAGVYCTVGVTPLCLSDASQDFESVGRPVALAEETIDRSSTSGLVLARLNPDMFLYQSNGSSALSVDDQSATSTGIMNTIYVTEAQTAGSFVPVYIHHTSTGNASAALHEYNILSYLNLNGTYDQAGYNRNILAQMNLSGTLNSGGAHFYPIYAQLTGTPTATAVGHIAAIGIDCNLGVNPTSGNYTGILIANNGANQTQVDSAITIYGNYGINTLFDFESCDGLSGNFISNLGTGANKVITSGTAGTTYKVKVNYGGNDTYLILYSDPTEAAN